MNPAVPIPTQLQAVEHLGTGGIILTILIGVSGVLITVSHRMKRPQAWWDAIAILDGAVGAAVAVWMVGAREAGLSLEDEFKRETESYAEQAALAVSATGLR